MSLSATVDKLLRLIQAVLEFIILFITSDPWTSFLREHFCSIFSFRTSGGGLQEKTMSPLPLLPLRFLVSVFPLHLLAYSAGAGPNRSGAAAEAGKLIFILAGQSNMAGRGGVAGDRWNHVVPPECRPRPAILRLNAALRWEEAREPLHSDIDVLKTCGVGPGMSFAHEILSSSAAAPTVVGLVPCAIGGTKITQWRRGTQLYGEMVHRTREAGGGGGGPVGAVLWYQGESDTVSLADAEAYKGRMEMMIRDLRSDLGLPGLLVIQVSGWLPSSYFN